MSIEIAIVQYLTDEIPDVKVYPYWIPRGADMPCIAVHRRSGDYQHDIEGSAGYASPQFQFSVFSHAYAETKALAEQIRQALQGYSGEMLGCEIYSITHSNEFDLYEAPEDASDKAIYHTASLYNVLYEIETPSLSVAQGVISNSQVEIAILNYLLSAPPLTDLIGSRLTALKIPRTKPYPAVVMSRSTGGHEHDITGSAGFVLARLDFTVYGTNYLSCVAVRDKLRLLLDGLSGVYSGCNIFSVTAQQSSDSPIAPADGSEQWTHATSLSFNVLYQETVPIFA